MSSQKESVKALDRWLDSHKGITEFKMSQVDGLPASFRSNHYLIEQLKGTTKYCLYPRKDDAWTYRVIDRQTQDHMLRTLLGM